MNILRLRKGSSSTQNSASSSSLALFQAEHDRLAAESGTLAYKGAKSSSSLPPNQGPCPAGELTIRLSKTPCPGFKPACGTIELVYKIPDGPAQSAFHPHPGQPYTGAHRMAFLPDNAEGRRLLTRYQVAWLRGHSLEIGYSVALKRDNQVKWRDSLPHKTSLVASKTNPDFSFPDPKFLDKAEQALNALGVPNCNDCLALLPHSAMYQKPGEEEEEVQMASEDEEEAKEEEKMEDEDESCESVKKKRRSVSPFPLLNGCSNVERKGPPIHLPATAAVHTRNASGGGDLLDFKDQCRAHPQEGVRVEVVKDPSGLVPPADAAAHTRSVSAPQYGLNNPPQHSHHRGASAPSPLLAAVARNAPLGTIAAAAHARNASDPLPHYKDQCRTRPEERNPGESAPGAMNGGGVVAAATAGNNSEVDNNNDSMAEVPMATHVVPVTADNDRSLYDNGSCAKHPDVQLRERQDTGAWRTLKEHCPRCHVEWELEVIATCQQLNINPSMVRKPSL